MRVKQERVDEAIANYRQALRLKVDRIPADGMIPLKLS